MHAVFTIPKEKKWPCFANKTVKFKILNPKNSSILGIKLFAGCSGGGGGGVGRGEGRGYPVTSPYKYYFMVLEIPNSFYFATDFRMFSFFFSSSPKCSTYYIY